MSDRANAAERRWMGYVRALPCVLCRLLGVPQTTPTNVHHLKAGTGMSDRSPHYLTVALCVEHHQGASGIHWLGTRGFATRYNLDELDLLNLTVEGVFRMLGAGGAAALLGNLAAQCEAIAATGGSATHCVEMIRAAAGGFTSGP